MLHANSYSVSRIRVWYTCMLNFVRGLGIRNSTFGINYKLRGSLTFNRPLQVYINGNWITDVVTLDISTSTNCDQITHCLEILV